MSAARNERGGAGVEGTAWLLLLPVTLLLLFGGFQAAQMTHARQATLAAAQAACEQARTLSGGDPDAAMARIVSQTGLNDPDLTITTTTTMVTCTVTGRAPMLIELGDLFGDTSETVTMPREGTRP